MEGFMKPSSYYNMLAVVFFILVSFLHSSVNVKDTAAIWPSTDMSLFVVAVIYCMSVLLLAALW